jgi:uncharacterized protein
MIDDAFEWDDDKAASNVRKHGVTFEMARDVFDDPFILEREDRAQDAGEDRYSVLGISEGRLLFVGFTHRGDRIRIISARLATTRERKSYHDANEA